MNILIWIVLGSLAGFASSLLLENSEKSHVWSDIATGVVGALLMGITANAFMGEELSASTWYSFVFAILGALIIIWTGKIIGKTGSLY